MFENDSDRRKPNPLKMFSLCIYFRWEWDWTEDCIGVGRYGGWEWLGRTPARRPPTSTLCDCSYGRDCNPDPLLPRCWHLCQWAEDLWDDDSSAWNNNKIRPYALLSICTEGKVFLRKVSIAYYRLQRSWIYGVYFCILFFALFIFPFVSCFFHFEFGEWYSHE
jgi:hypothetical protein